VTRQPAIPSWPRTVLRRERSAVSITDRTQVFDVPRERFDFEVFPGQILHAQLANSQLPPLQVLAVGEQLVTLDGNHPLAGKTLCFEVTIVAVRPASAEELRFGFTR